MYYYNDTMGQKNWELPSKMYSYIPWTAWAELAFLDILWHVHIILVLHDGQYYL